MSLSDQVEEAKKALRKTRKRKRAPPPSEEEELEFAEEPADLSVAQEEGPAELDDSRSSLVTHVSGEHEFDGSREQREVLTPDEPKAKTPKRRKKPPCVSTGTPREQASASASAASASENSDGPSLPQILRMAESALQQIERLADDFTASGRVPDEPLTSMHQEDLGSDTDSATEDELVVRSRSGGGDAVSTTASRSQRRSQSEGQLSPGTPGSPPGSPPAGPSTAPSTGGKSAKKAAATTKKISGVLGSVCNLVNFQAWRTSLSGNDGRLLGDLALVELDALLGSYLRYLWEGGNRHLTHALMVLQARSIDRYIKSQGCFHCLLRSPELPAAAQLLAEYLRALRERETDGYGALICGASAAEEEELRRAGVLGRGSPAALLHLVLYNNIRAYGPAHLYRMWPAPAGKFRFMRVVPAQVGARPELDCLEWTDPADPEQTPLRMLGTPSDPSRCPLEDFRLYCTKHAGGFLSYSDPVYSNVRPTRGADPASGDWYLRTPISKQRMAKLLAALAQRIQSARATLGALPPV
ncbi:uncharacterized protein LOC134102327 [Sardina pilchardus]|uniref:uncharacterized protein LOC134102327 n=1 Tax=Sardina pilchardus TaxID=27697 RepID=UPI002E1463F6